MCRQPEPSGGDRTGREAPPPVLAIGEPGRAATEVSPGPPVAAGVPDIALTTASTARVELRAASVRGLQHRAAAEPRQDAFALQLAGNDELIAVVCDGIGSLPRSHEAAGLAAQRLAELGRNGVEWAVAFKDVNDELVALVGAASTMATTALAVRVRADEHGWHGQAAWVGDSPLWHLSVDADWTACTHSDVTDDDEALHSTASAALPATNLQVAELDLDHHDGALFLMSDGVGNPLAWIDQVQTALARWWAAPPDIFDFGRQVAFARRTHVDDRTVVGLWRRP
jgi:serine/threonine protein phosphatase PrpC